jgi:hypothetical protein
VFVIKQLFRLADRGERQGMGLAQGRQLCALAQGCGFVAEHLVQRHAHGFATCQGAGVCTATGQERYDLADESGRALDFHCLRVTFVSNLVAAGVHPRVAQALVP